MNVHFWNKVGLLLFIIGMVGMIPIGDNKYLWLFPLLAAIGGILYLMPEKYYEKNKKEINE